MPSGVSLMFAGFRSRWTMPFSCASSSASAICCAIASASSSGNAPALQPLGEVSPSTSSIARKWTAAPSVERRALEAVDVGDVRVVERGEQLRLALEAGEALRVGGEGRGQDLDRDLAPELRVGGAIDLAHAAFAELGGDP